MSDPSTVAIGAQPPSRDILQPWRKLFWGSLLAGLFVQAVLAGLMLSGVGWAHTAHSGLALVLVAASLVGGLAALANLRRARDAARLGLTFLALAAVLAVQAVLGALAAKKGLNVLWLHIPLGVALVGAAVQGAVAAGRPRRE